MVGLVAQHYKCVETTALSTEIGLSGLVLGYAYFLLLQ